MSAQTATEDRLADLETIADELLAADPTPEDVEDLEDSAYLAASGTVPWKALGADDGHMPGPSLSVVPALSRSTSWHDRAACRDATSETFTEARSQAEGTSVIETYCSACPVVAECLSDARFLRSWGVAGGLVLVDGRKAPLERPRSSPGARSARAGRDTASTWLAGRLADGPRLRAEVLAQAEQVGIPSSTLRKAARRLQLVSTTIQRGRAERLWSLPECIPNSALGMGHAEPGPGGPPGGRPQQHRAAADNAGRQSAPAGPGGFVESSVRRPQQPAPTR